MIKSIESNWKKNNLIDTRIYNEVDLIIPITNIKSTTLKKKLLFNDKSIIVNSTSGFKDQGFLKIQNEIIFSTSQTLPERSSFSYKFRYLKREYKNEKLPKKQLKCGFPWKVSFHNCYKKQPH